MTLIRRNPVEELTEEICNNICKYSMSDLIQDEINEKCRDCILNRIEDVVLAESR